MAGVLRTPRPVPGLNTQVVKASSQVVATNDEVGAILKGLQLDKKWFMDRLRAEPLQRLAPLPPGGPELRPRTSSNGNVKDDEMRRPSRRRGKTAKFSSAVASRNGTSDFDIYLNEAVMPVLAQSLDALCRQLARMQEQGDQLDPKVRARFNPLTWLAQQLLRRHPKCARTPRRQVLYRGFKDWGDWEKGRRELLRRRTHIEEVFNGFVLRGVVQYDTVGTVIAAVDDTFKLQGAFKNNAALQEALTEAMNKAGHRLDFASPLQKKGSCRMTAAERNTAGFTFEEFWYHVANCVMKNEVVPYSLILRGLEALKQQETERLQYEKREAADLVEREKLEGEKRERIAAYTALYEQLIADPIIVEICSGSKILSGDDVRPTDVGYEFEAPPFGPHVALLSDLMELLGLDLSVSQEEPEDKMVGEYSDFGGVFRASAKNKGVESAEDEKYWDENMAKAWGVIQRAHHAEADDGVVDGEILKQALVPPVGFDLLRAKVEYDLEHSEGDVFSEQLSRVIGTSANEAKPSMEQLCQRLGMTMSRLEWLHTLFESFLAPLDPDDPDAPPPCCLYPECPASLDREQMRALVSEVEPHLTRGQFEARFLRIDSDGSGLIEFDEFAIWVHSSDVRIQGHMTVKMTFLELANRYQEPVELIKYLHTCFQDQLPEDVNDTYPDDPVGLAKADAFVLASILVPAVEEDDFNENFELVDASSRQTGHCDFDEFLEIIDLDDLPAELRDRFEMEN